jgi:hypothetical protein
MCFEAEYRPATAVKIYQHRLALGVVGVKDSNAHGTMRSFDRGIGYAMHNGTALCPGFAGSFSDTTHLGDVGPVVGQQFALGFGKSGIELG